MESSRGSEAYRMELKATAGMAAWGAAWVASLALARFGPGLWGESSHAATWVAIAVNLIVGVGWIAAYVRFLRTIDELQRKILQDALAAAVGGGLVLGSGYVVAQAGGLIPAEVDFAVFPIAMAVVYLIAFIVGRIRYR